MDRAAIGDQIDRILHSRSFAGKSQLAKLLEVLFHHMDSQTTLKPDRVIKELWPEEIKTKRSADVATEMNRLRKTLECYYNGEGATDPIIINGSAQESDEVRILSGFPKVARRAKNRPISVPVSAEGLIWLVCRLRCENDAPWKSGKSQKSDFPPIPTTLGNPHKTRVPTFTQRRRLRVR
jgi:hypothetical protein